MPFSQHIFRLDLIHLNWTRLIPFFFFHPMANSDITSIPFLHQYRRSRRLTPLNPPHRRFLPPSTFVIHLHSKRVILLTVNMPLHIIIQKQVSCPNLHTLFFNRKSIMTPYIFTCIPLHWYIRKRPNNFWWKEHLFITGERGLTLAALIFREWVKLAGCIEIVA